MNKVNALSIFLEAFFLNRLSSSTNSHASVHFPRRYHSTGLEARTPGSTAPPGARVPSGRASPVKCGR